MHFQDNFQQDNAHLHKSKNIGKFFQEKECKVLEWPAYSPDSNQKLRAIFTQRLHKQFLKNVQKCQKFGTKLTQMSLEAFRKTIQTFC